MSQPWTCAKREQPILKGQPFTTAIVPGRSPKPGVVSGKVLVHKNDVFTDEPQARDRVRALLSEIMVDELAHIGQRRNFLGPLGVRAARWLVKPVFRSFFAMIGESKQLFDVDQMIRDGLAFDYSGLPPEVLRRSWIPSYCTVSLSVTTP